MKKSLFLLVPLFSLSLMSCAQERSFMLVPSGAPTVPLYGAIIEGNVETTTNTTSIPGQLLTGNYNYIVFDSVNAQAVLNKEGSNAKYSFARMLTGGNFHLLGFGKENHQLPTNDDYIIGFNEQATPGKMFRKIFTDRTDAFNENKDGVQAVKTVLETLTPEYTTASGQKIDWALVADPVCSALKAQFNKKGITGIKDIDLQAKFKETVPGWEKDYICQAALFVNKDYREHNFSAHQEFMSTLNTNIDGLFTNLEGALTKISETFTTEEEITNHFGVGLQPIRLAQGQDSAKNGLGIIPSSEVFTVQDIELFTSLLK